MNDTGKAEAIAVSDARAKATADSIMDYIHKATPTVVRDLITPVGNYTGQPGSPISFTSFTSVYAHTQHKVSASMYRDTCSL